MRSGEDSVLLNYGETEWKLPHLLYDDVDLFIKSEQEQDRLVAHFEDVCRRRILKVKILVIERNRLSQCNISLSDEVINDYRYLRVISKNHFRKTKVKSSRAR